MSSSALVVSETPLENATAWQAWGLIKQELLFLCWALMDVSIIAPIALIVMRWAQYWSVGYLTLWLLLLILLPFNLVRLISALEIPDKYQWRLLLAVLVMVLLVSWRGLLYAPRPLFDLSWLAEFFSHLGDLQNPLWARDIAVFLFGLIAWWRGLRLAQLTPNISRIGLRLRAGVLLLAPLALILNATGRLWAATPYILLYFLAGLTAVALIRAEQIERERSGFAASLTPRWVLTIFVTSLLVIMTAGLIAAIISGEAMTVLSGRLTPLWKALVATLAVSLSTMIFLFTPVINVLILLFTWFTRILSDFSAGLQFGFGEEGTGNLDALLPFDFLLREEGLVSLNLPANVGRTLVAALMLGVAAIITFFLTRLFRQPPAAKPPGSVQSSGSALDGSPASLSERLLQRLGLLNRWRAAASIRRIYSSMCQVAADAGYPRGMAQTPYEYLTTLSEVWPAYQADSRLITEAYIRVRYGEVPETDAELQTIKSAWQRLSDVQIEAVTRPAFTTVDKQ